METRIPASERTSQRLNELLTHGVAEGDARGNSSSSPSARSSRKRWKLKWPRRWAAAITRTAPRQAPAIAMATGAGACAPPKARSGTACRRSPIAPSRSIACARGIGGSHGGTRTTRRRNVRPRAERARHRSGFPRCDGHQRAEPALKNDCHSRPSERRSRRVPWRRLAGATEIVRWVTQHVAGSPLRAAGCKRSSGFLFR